jgi:hypothetical protein
MTDEAPTGAPIIRVALVIEPVLGIKPIATDWGPNQIKDVTIRLREAKRQNQGWMVPVWAGGDMYISPEYVKKIALITTAAVAHETPINEREGIPVSSVLTPPTGIALPAEKEKNVIVMPPGKFRPNLTDPNTDPNAPTIG